MGIGSKMGNVDSRQNAPAPINLGIVLIDLRDDQKERR